MGGRDRLQSIDFLRGAIMIVMALDHVRDFLQPAHDYGPANLRHASTALFLTRWVTHFCAPVFVFLAGTSAYLWRARGRSGADLTRFLLTRGAWLVVLELTIVRFAWLFDLHYARTSGSVLWAIGLAMIALAGLARLPTAWCGAIGIAIVALHNLTDGVSPADFGALDWLWAVLHEPDALHIAAGHTFLTVYPVLPWIGVIAAGYAFGQVVTFERARRRRWLLALGIGLTVGFVALRAIGVYGDARPWSPDSDRAVLAFLNTVKYPPSLAFALMTLGPALLLLWAIDERAVPGAVVTFGRVPMFYYVVHLYVIHLVALAIRSGAGADKAWGLSLPWIYATWLAVVLALYPACRWYAGVKQRSHSPWLSYL